MYRLMVEGEFSAAHKLRDYNGKCENLHGHNWKVKVTVCGSNLAENGLLVDFQLLRKKLCEVMDKLDHNHLNTLSFFRSRNPSSENIAFFIYGNMKKKLKAYQVIVEKVTVWENSRQSASYGLDEKEN